MDLRRSPALVEVYQGHTRTLGRIHACLLDAVPRAYEHARVWAEPAEVHGATLGNCVREFTIKKIGESKDESDTRHSYGSLDFSIGPNRSLVFSDYKGKVRVRKLPIDWQRKRTVPLPIRGQVELPLQLELYRTFPKNAKEELVILWKPDPRNARLSRAVLASVFNIKDSSKTRVFDYVDLPDPEIEFYGNPPVPPQPGGFDDFFGNSEGIIDPDSA